MNQIILAVIRKAGVINIKEIIRRTAFSRKEIKDTLYLLQQKGKISFINLNTPHLSPCSECRLKHPAQCHVIKRI